MPKNQSPAVIKWNIILFSIALLDVAVDQLSKWWIQSHFTPGQSVPATGFFRITYEQNTGAAFSIFSGRTDILAVVSVVGVILVLVYNFYFAHRYPFLNTRLNKVALGLILGGTIGNLIDRVWLHYVRDFIAVGSWPVFNVADSTLDVGVVIFAVSILFFTRTAGAKKP
jgi:signal peptidase II